MLLNNIQFKSYSSEHNWNMTAVLNDEGVEFISQDCGGMLDRAVLYSDSYHNTKSPACRE